MLSLSKCTGAFLTISFAKELPLSCEWFAQRLGVQASKIHEK